MRFIAATYVLAFMLFVPNCSRAAESDELLNDSGLVYYYRGRYPEALQNFLNAAEANPKNPEVYFNIGRAYNKLRNPEKALTALQKAVELKPVYPAAKTVLKKIEAELAGRDKSSVQTFSRNYKIVIPPEISYPYPDFTEGFYAYYGGDRRDSLEKFERDASKHEKAAQANMDQGIINYHTGYFSEAIKFFQKAAAADPKNASAWFDLGLCYEQSGRQENAIASYEKAAGLDANLTDADRRAIMIKDNIVMNQMNAADYYFKKRQWAPAIKSYEKAREMTLPHSNEYAQIESRINVARIELDKIKEINAEINKAYLNRNISFADANRFPSRYIGSLVTWSAELGEIERYGLTTDLIMYHLPGIGFSPSRQNRSGRKENIFIIRLDRPFPEDLITYNICDMTVVGRIVSSERLRNAFRYGDYTDKIVVKPLKIELLER